MPYNLDHTNADRVCDRVKRRIFTDVIQERLPFLGAGGNAWSPMHAATCLTNIWRCSCLPGGEKYRWRLEMSIADTGSIPLV